MEAPYGLPANSHAQATSTGTADVKTISAPAGAHGVYITVQTNGCYLSLDGTNPSATHGLHLIKDLAPLFLPTVEDLKVASDAAANSVVSVIWVS